MNVNKTRFCFSLLLPSDSSNSSPWSPEPFGLQMHLLLQGIKMAFFLKRILVGVLLFGCFPLTVFLLNILEQSGAGATGP